MGLSKQGEFQNLRLLPAYSVHVIPLILLETNKQTKKKPLNNILLHNFAKTVHNLYMHGSLRAGSGCQCSLQVRFTYFMIQQGWGCHFIIPQHSGTIGHEKTRCDLMNSQEWL